MTLYNQINSLLEELPETEWDQDKFIFVDPDNTTENDSENLAEVNSLLPTNFDINEFNQKFGYNF